MMMVRPLNVRKKSHTTHDGDFEYLIEWNDVSRIGSLKRMYVVVKIQDPRYVKLYQTRDTVVQLYSMINAIIYFCIPYISLE